jgi:hypothetical protein
MGSISKPPEKSGPVASNVIGSRGVAARTFATYRARYSPRSRVGFLRSCRRRLDSSPRLNVSDTLRITLPKGVLVHRHRANGRLRAKERDDRQHVLVTL